MKVKILVMEVLSVEGRRSRHRLESSCMSRPPENMDVHLCKRSKRHVELLVQLPTTPESFAG